MLQNWVLCSHSLTEKPWNIFCSHKHSLTTEAVAVCWPDSWIKGSYKAGKNADVFTCSPKVDHGEMWWWPSVYECCTAGPWCNLHCETGKSGLTSDPAFVKVGDLSPRFSRKTRMSSLENPVLSSLMSFTFISHEQWDVPWDVPGQPFMAWDWLLQQLWAHLSSPTNGLLSHPEDQHWTKTNLLTPSAHRQHSYRELIDEFRLLLHRKITQIFSSIFGAVSAAHGVPRVLTVTDMKRKRRETQHTNSLLNTVCSNYRTLTAS